MENIDGFQEVTPFTFEQVENAFARWRGFCAVNAQSDEQDTHDAALVLCELLGLDEGTLRLAGAGLIEMMGHPAAGCAAMCGFFVALLLADERLVADSEA